MATAKDFFTKDQVNAITSAITGAEKNTSGEIRVHVENKCKGEVIDRAADLFRKLEMDKTKLRNGVLIYLAIGDRKFAIIGDSGINAVVPPDFWDGIKENMRTKFKEGKFEEGLCESISQSGEHLKKHFPRQSDDVNELPDDISFYGG